MSAGRTGLGEAVDWNELHKRGQRLWTEETDLSGLIRGFTKKGKASFFEQTEEAARLQTGESGDVGPCLRIRCF